MDAHRPRQEAEALDHCAQRLARRQPDIGRQTHSTLRGIGQQRLERPLVVALRPAYPLWAPPRPRRCKTPAGRYPARAAHRAWRAQPQVGGEGVQRRLALGGGSDSRRMCRSPSRRAPGVAGPARRMPRSASAAASSSLARPGPRWRLPDIPIAQAGDQAARQAIVADQLGGAIFGEARARRARATPRTARSAPRSRAASSPGRSRYGVRPWHAVAPRDASS